MGVFKSRRNEAVAEFLKATSSVHLESMRSLVTKVGVLTLAGVTFMRHLRDWKHASLDFRVHYFRLEQKWDGNIDNATYLQKGRVLLYGISNCIPQI